MFFVHILVETTKKLKIIVYLYDACYVGINESDIYDDSYGSLINDILSIAVSETSTENRLAIIESFTPPYSPFR